jgi:hypothetical protein
MFHRQQGHKSDKSNQALQKQHKTSHTTAPPVNGTHSATLIQRAKLNPNSLNTDDVLRLQQTIGNRATTQLIAGRSGQRVQAKLTIGEPENEYEREADRVAEEVVKQIDAPVSQQAGQNLQREEMSSEEKELQMKPMLQLRAAEGGMTATVGMETAINQARGGGQLLADNVRKPMEQFLGADFSRVKVHTDPKADQLNRSLMARAFTTGQDVFFRKGEYNPASREGQKLIFHEVAHVAQQNGNKVEGHQQETGKVSKKLGIIQRMNVAAQQHNGATTFQNNHPGYDHLVVNITQNMSAQQIVNQLLQNFHTRQDFDYTGTYSPQWGDRGDCHTLVDEFITTAGYFNIQMNHTPVNGPLFIPNGGTIIHNQRRTGNVDNGRHWRFDNHHIAQWNGTTIDVLFGRMQAMPAVEFQEGTEAEFTIQGTTYYFANDTTRNESNTFTSDRNNRMDFSSLSAPRREIKTRFCCCTIM